MKKKSARPSPQNRNNKTQKRDRGSIKSNNQQAQVRLAELCARMALIVGRTSLVNAVRELVNALGEGLPNCDPAQLGTDQMKSLPVHLQKALRPLLDGVASLTEKIDLYEDVSGTRYVTEPFLLRELATASKASPNAKVLLAGRIELDPGRRSMKKDGRPVHLTPKEFDVLHYLMQHNGIAVGHEELLHAVWGPEYGEAREYLRTIIRQLRLKVENDPSRPVHLLTDASIGYQFGTPSTSRTAD